MRSRSTTQAALQVVNQVLPAINQNFYSKILLMDLSKAFDCVLHKMLLIKLHRYGIKNDTLRLIQSYLTNRKQRVQILSTLSDYTDVRVGVPQGSVLGPLLYIIFANDLTNIIHNVNITTYADDIALFSTSNSLNELIDKFNPNVNIVQNCHFLTLSP